MKDNPTFSVNNTLHSTVCVIFSIPYLVNMLLKLFLLYYMRAVVWLHHYSFHSGWTKKQSGSLIIGESEGTDDQAIRQIRHSETLQLQSITATTQLFLNVTLWLHCELAAEPSVWEKESGWKVKETKEEESEWHALGRNWPEKRKRREQSSCGDKTFWKDVGGWERLVPKDWDGQVARWLTHSFTFTQPLLSLFDRTHISADYWEYTQLQRQSPTAQFHCLVEMIVTLSSKNNCINSN